MLRSLPLDGIRVLDASRVLAGPFATMLLADLGAEVVKIEPPGGDESRGWGPPWWGEPGDARSAYFASVNCNKRSVVLDLRNRAGRGILDRLAAASDLLVHNHRPTVAARLGLDAARLEARYPELVVVGIGSFAGDAAARERPAYDLLAQAVTGHMAITGERGGGPVRMGVAMLDLVAGLEAALGGLAALVGRGRARGGRARRIEVSLIEVGVTSLINVLGGVLASGEAPERWGSGHPTIVPYQAFAASDGELVIAVGNDAQFTRLLDALGLADRRGRFATNADRVAHRDELVAMLAAAIATRRRDDLLEALAGVDVPAGPVSSVSEALAAMEEAHPDRWVQERDGIKHPPDPIMVDGQRLPLRRAPPRLGEHTDEVLMSIGLDAGEIASLRDRGVIG